MFVIFAATLLLSMPKPNLVVAFKPYLSAIGSLSLQHFRRLVMYLAQALRIKHKGFPIIGNFKASFGEKAQT
jgi:hypothetical protein